MADNILMTAISAVKQKISKLNNKSTVSYGSAGTSIFDGIITEEFNSSLQFPKSIEIYDEMRRSDATVNATLEAIKQPIISAKWFFTPASESEEDVAIAEFAHHALFEKINWKEFLEEALTYLEFGFFYAEKIYELSMENKQYPGYIMWKELAPRQQNAHYKWGIDGQEWKNGHPAGITQQLKGQTDDLKEGADTRPVTPWDKLIVFNRKREGVNYDGISLLRSAYKHWYYKDLLYKIASISAERYGVGVPWAKSKAGAGTGIEDKMDEMLMSLRSNEQSYIRLNSDIEDWGIMTPSGNPESGSIQYLIDHHDRKIYDNVLAGFLNLSTGDGGSNALSKDQSSFFLRGLMGIADYIKGVMQAHIDELIHLNFQGVMTTPKLTCTDIGSISMDEAINSIVAAVGGGLITINPSDEDAIREILKLPPAPEDNEDVEVVTDEQEDVEEVAEKAEFSEKKTLKPSDRERTFLKNINQYEKFLDKEFEEFDGILSEFEEKYRKGMVAIYEASDTERVDGVVSLKYDKKMVKKAEGFIKEVTKRLEKRIVDSPAQRRLFEGTKKMAKEMIKDNYKKLADTIEVDAGQFDAFVKGYESNVAGVLFNEPRRMMEDVIMNYGSGVSLDLAISQAKGMTFNRNIYKLSTITHARGAYQGILFKNAQKDGFTFYKVLVPPGKMGDVDPKGRTAGILFTIGTAAMINKILSKKTDGKNSDAVKGMGIGHGSYEYYYPIESDMLDEEEEIAKAQRKEFLNS